jgi:hypothetical protein
MIYGQSRSELREFYVTAWRKHRAGEPLGPLEQLVAAVIDRHPEYHALLESVAGVAGREYTPEQGKTNPFLHMGMHLTLQEQVSIDRPAGITALYVNMLSRTGDAHKVEHRMMECLGETLWEAQRNNTPPDEQLYMERLKKLA